MTTLLDKAKENIDNFHNCTHLHISNYLIMILINNINLIILCLIKYFVFL